MRLGAGTYRGRRGSFSFNTGARDRIEYVTLGDALGAHVWSEQAPRNTMLSGAGLGWSGGVQFGVQAGREGVNAAVNVARGEDVDWLSMGANLVGSGLDLIDAKWGSGANRGGPVSPVVPAAAYVPQAAAPSAPAASQPVVVNVNMPAAPVARGPLPHQPAPRQRVQAQQRKRPTPPKKFIPPRPIVLPKDNKKWWIIGAAAAAGVVAATVL